MKYFLICGLLPVVALISSCGGGGDSLDIGGDDTDIGNNLVNEPIEELIVYTSPTNISNTPGFSRYESFSISSDGVIHATWVDNGEILYSSSSDNGTSFKLPKVIVPSSAGYHNEYAQIALTASTIHLAWTVYDSNRGAEVFYIRSIDGANSFTDPVLVSVDDGLNSYASSISTDHGNRVSIAWSNEDGGGARTRLTVSENEGVSFTTPKTLPLEGLSPKTFLTSSAIYATWTDGGAFVSDVYFAKSTNGGMNFSTPMNISQNTDKSWNGEIATDVAGTLYIVWVSGTAFVDRKIMLAISVDGGLSFSMPVILSDPMTDSFCPSITASEMGRFYVTWSSSDDNYATNRTYLVASENGGMTYSQIQQLPMMSIDSRCPTIRANGQDQIGMIWSDTGAGSDQLPDILFSNVQVTIP